MARRLEGPELGAYDLIATDVARRVLVQAWPVLPRGADGMTLGRLVLVRRDHDRTGSSALLAHELVHVEQYRDRGWPRFLATYLLSYLDGMHRHRRHRAAYLAIPAEVAARDRTRAWVSRRGTEPSAQETRPEA